MSEENVEAICGTIDAWNRGDLDAYLEGFHPEAEWHPGVTRVDGTVIRGHDGIREWWADIHTTFEELTVTIAEFRDLGESVLGLGRVRGQSKSGVPLDAEYALLMHPRDGLAVSGRAFTSHAEALEAAGLSE